MEIKEMEMETVVKQKRRKSEKENTQKKKQEDLEIHVSAYWKNTEEDRKNIVLLFHKITQKYSFKF